MYTPNGAYQTITHALVAFIAWRRTRGNLHPRTHATWNLLFAPPAPSMSPTVMLAVATTDRLTAADRAAGIVECEVPRGRYARLRLEGSDALIGPAIECLRDVWCAARAVSPASGPVLLRRVRLYPDVAEHDACSDLYLPLSD
jgi:AraC family transcriptional regulator